MNDTHASGSDASTPLHGTPKRGIQTIPLVYQFEERIARFQQPGLAQPISLRPAFSGIVHSNREALAHPATGACSQTPCLQRVDPSEREVVARRRRCSSMNQPEQGWNQGFSARDSRDDGFKNGSFGKRGRRLVADVCWISFRTGCSSCWDRIS